MQSLVTDRPNLTFGGTYPQTHTFDFLAIIRLLLNFVQ